MVRAVLFDVDFTLSRPGPELGGEGFVRYSARYGLYLDAAAYEPARLSALEELQHHPELVHDEEVWIAFTEQVIIGMGGGGDSVRPCAEELVRLWERHEHFHLYEDVMPVLDDLRGRGVSIGLVTNGLRDVEEFAEHHGLVVDVAVSARSHGRMKPHPTIFEAALVGLGVSADETAMVGDSYDDDVAGARAVGMRALLLDREGRYPPGPDVIPTLLALPAALGLELR